MTLYPIKSKSDLIELRKLADQQKQLSNQRVQEKIIQQTLDDDLAKQLAPITKKQDEQKQVFEKHLEALNLQRSSSIDQNVITGLLNLQRSSSIDQNVITGLSPMLYSNNKELKLEHDTGNSFKLNNKQVEIDGNIMKIDNNDYVLTPNVISALTKSNIDLTTLNDYDFMTFYGILNDTNYSFKSNPDRKSKRAKYIKNILPERIKVLEQPAIQGEGLKNNRKSTREFVFLSSDPNTLFDRIIVLIGEHEAGNNNVFQEGSAILDELWRMKILTSIEYEKFFVLLNK